MNKTTHTFLDESGIQERLASLQDAWGANRDGIQDAPSSREVNNHVHTRYSFSPYTPAAAAWHARLAGLRALGSVDHESIGAAPELMQAGRIIGIGTTVGVEVRVSFAGTPFAGRRLNNPDSDGNAYIVIHGVPDPSIPRMAAFLAPLVAARRRRNARQVERLNAILERSRLPALDYPGDVEAISWVHHGGTVTERHILYALALLLERTFSRGPALASAVEERFGLAMTGTQREQLEDPQNPHYLYDVLGLFKGGFVDSFFVQPDEDECLPYHQVNEFAREIGAIPAYSYLGDVGESPTGDKKAQTFEDSFLDELIQWVPQAGFQAVTYMPPRNTPEQLKRVQALCRDAGLLEISGVDINSSRQVFTCPEILQPEFQHLNETTWALIAHEKLSAREPRLGLFHPGNPLAGEPLRERIARYSSVGRECDPHHPEAMAEPAGAT